MGGSLYVPFSISSIGQYTQTVHLRVRGHKIMAANSATKMFLIVLFGFTSLSGLMSPQICLSLLVHFLRKILEKCDDLRSSKLYQH